MFQSMVLVLVAFELRILVNNGSVSAVRLRFQFGFACDRCLFQLLCFMFSLVFLCDGSASVWFCM